MGTSSSNYCVVFQVKRQTQNDLDLQLNKSKWQPQKSTNCHDSRCRNPFERNTNRGRPFDKTGGMKEDFKRFKGKCTLLVKERTQIAHTLFDFESRLKRFNESKVFLLALKSHLRISSFNWAHFCRSRVTSQLVTLRTEERVVLERVCKVSYPLNDRALADRGGDEGLIHSLIESRVVRLNKISIPELYALSLLKAFHCHRLRIKRKGKGAAYERIRCLWFRVV